MRLTAHRSSTSLVASLALVLVPLVAADDDSGCTMSAGSDLMNCLGTWASMPPVLSATGLAVGPSAEDLCRQYSQMADCWAAGTYCAEWLPVRTAADKFCALAQADNIGSSASLVPSSALSSVEAEASRVVTSIWNNDSGSSVPSITNDLETRSRPTATHAETAPAQTGTAATVAPSASASGSHA
ncbi:uncharacterized protein RHOBADRAFT_46708 [Rhodotorula graminis WP1]|uniref:Extracellular membrane protein CFEM domain-containing protein n=1 Tax=Rhodotorula graminis (strain WP1) TaxID=578459 RepID=A0A0P9EZL6_RHOGW|nr:uncharacterized protein RHOBADRAFT_46708 [Rhodotorula graminis WP1]KPV72664.1 hypothetical protein RHOBADRAFT_46708 [Rhodotorula graminis WP1]